MAAVYEEALKKDIAAKNPVGNYVLFGDDTYLINMYTKKLSSLIADSDDVFNYHKFSGKCDLQSVYDAAVQFPMMADKKCIIIKDYDYQKADKTDFERLLNIASEDFGTAVVIFVFDSIEFDHKKDAKAKKIIAAAEKSGGKAVILNHRRTPELVKMLCSAAIKRGCKIDSSVARYLIETSGDDILNLTNELNKLCHYANKGTITKETVDTVCIKSPEASVYNLTDSIIACDANKSFKIVDELFFSRIEPMIILHTISSAFVDIYRVYAARKKGISVNDAAQRLGYKNRAFVLEKAAQNLKCLDFRKLCLCFNAITNADKGLKGFNNERIVIEQLVIRLIYIIAKGEAID